MQDELELKEAIDYIKAFGCFPPQYFLLSGLKVTTVTKAGPQFVIEIVTDDNIGDLLQANLTEEITYSEKMLASLEDLKLQSQYEIAKGEINDHLNMLEKISKKRHPPPSHLLNYRNELERLKYVRERLSVRPTSLSARPTSLSGGGGANEFLKNIKNFLLMKRLRSTRVQPRVQPHVQSLSREEAAAAQPVTLTPVISIEEPPTQTERQTQVRAQVRQQVRAQVRAQPIKPKIVFTFVVSKEFFAIEQPYNEIAIGRLEVPPPLRYCLQEVITPGTDDEQKMYELNLFDSKDLLEKTLNGEASKYLLSLAEPRVQHTLDNGRVRTVFNTATNTVAIITAKPLFEVCKDADNPKKLYLFDNDFVNGQKRYKIYSLHLGDPTGKPCSIDLQVKNVPISGKPKYIINAISDSGDYDDDDDFKKLIMIKDRSGKYVNSSFINRINYNLNADTYEEPTIRGGAAKNKVRVLGRLRNVHMKGRTKYVMYKKELIKLADAKKLEKKR